MKTSAIEVHEMLSVFSVDEVEKRIGEVPGVESATVNFAAGTPPCAITRHSSRRPASSPLCASAGSSRRRPLPVRLADAAKVTSPRPRRRQPPPRLHRQLPLSQLPLTARPHPTRRQRLRHPPLHRPSRLPRPQPLQAEANRTNRRRTKVKSRLVWRNPLQALATASGA